MESEKFENLLNLALDATEREREKSLNLGVGYEPEENRWELIVKYSGDIMRLSRDNPEIRVEELSNEYAILNVPESAMDEVAEAVEVEYVEKPKRMYFAVREGKQASCITPLQSARYNLTGKGVIVAILDSGERVILLSGQKEPGKGKTPLKYLRFCVIFTATSETCTGWRM